MNVLFICRENVGRSQIAQTLYEKITGEQAYSAATHVNIEGQQIGERPLAEPVIRHMKGEGYDISDSIATQVTRKMVAHADHIIVLCEQDLLPNFVRESDKLIYWHIPDPCGKPDQVFEDLILFLKKKILDNEYTDIKNI